MQLFISWSGELSRNVATLLHEWIPTVLQSAEPFLSSTDIEKGSRWSDHVAQKLEECGFGIIILTKSNLSAPWILFEAGALSKMVGSSHVSSLMIGIDAVDVKQPLSQFQNTVFSKDDIMKLIQSINRASTTPLREEVLSRAFSALWPGFELSVINVLSEEHDEIVPAKLDSKSPDIESMRASLGELIQNIQSLREDFKKNRGGEFDLSDIRREIRIATRTRPVPLGLLKDLERARLLIFEEEGFDDEVVLNKDKLTQVNESLTRAIGYIRRNIRSTSYDDPINDVSKMQDN